MRDTDNNPLPNARILLHSNRYIYFSGNAGGFGITSARVRDSVTVSLDGYEVSRCELVTSKFQTIQLRLLQSNASIKRNRLLSLTKNLTIEDRPRRFITGETYSALVENDFVSAIKYPETGFAIHSNKASYSNVRRFLYMNSQVPRDAVRVEEMLNYFNFEPPELPADSVFGFRSYVSDCPWNQRNQLLFLQIAARKIDPQQIKPSNLVFLIDVSGSMDMPNRLPLLKSSFKLLVDNLREKDTVSIVVYGGVSGIWLPPTSGKEKEKIRKSIEDLHAGGATPGASGIYSAYQLAKSQYIEGGNNRVILATDGDFNIGQHSDDELERLITQHQQSGVYLTCLGVGMGNYKDSKLEILAKKGNGNFAYLDTEEEAEKVLVTELTQTLYTVADDVSLNVQFNPQMVKSYRLIGFDNKLRAIEDTLSRIEGGEVGPGQALLVLFEFDPLTPMFSDNTLAKLANIDIHYRYPTDSLMRCGSYVSYYDHVEFAELPASFRFATSVALFASLLKESKFVGKSAWNDAIILAHDAHDKSDPIQKEFVEMIEKAKRIYSRKKKK